MHTEANTHQPANASLPGTTVKAGLVQLLRTPVGVISVALPLVLFAYFFGFHGFFEANHGATVLRWLSLTWNERNELEHAWLVPPVIVYLLYSQRKTLLEGPYRPATGWGITLTAIAAFLFLASVRTLQPRLAVGALPIFLIGYTCFHAGLLTARSVTIPFGLIYFTVPVPGLTQATNGLQVFATAIAYHVGRLCGIDLIRQGNNLASTADKWGFDVAEGCSGLRSLLALTLVAAIYAYMTQKTLLKGLLVFASSIPLAIVANAIRVATIILLAEYVSPTFAGGVYHDWAGFLFFLAVGLSGLLLVDRIVNLSATKVTVRRITKETEDHDS